MAIGDFQLTLPLDHQPLLHPKYRRQKRYKPPKRPTDLDLSNKDLCTKFAAKLDDMYTNFRDRFDGDTEPTYNSIINAIQTTMSSICPPKSSHMGGNHLTQAGTHTIGPCSTTTAS